MLGKRSYLLGWNCHTGVWQICSPSGHVLHESSSRREISALCTRLNRQFPRRKPAAPERPALPSGVMTSLFANVGTAMSPAFG